MSLSNVRTLKCILRNYELASGLRVNFHKSGLMGWCQHTANILNCKVGDFPFKFQGILVTPLLLFSIAPEKGVTIIVGANP